MGDATFEYEGEVWVNEYGLTLGGADSRYLQHELARRLGTSWADLANWHGVLRIRIDLVADDQPAG